MIRLRTAQLACLLLLLTSIGAAERPARADSPLSHRYISVLLLHRTSVARADTPLSRRLNQPATAQPTTFPELTRSIWTMRPPSAHSVLVHAVTGSGI